MPRGRKRKVNERQETEETVESGAGAGSPANCTSLTQNSDGKFVPQFSKRQKTAVKPAREPAAVSAGNDESGGVEEIITVSVCSNKVQTEDSTTSSLDMKPCECNVNMSQDIQNNNKEVTCDNDTSTGTSGNDVDQLVREKNEEEVDDHEENKMECCVDEENENGSKSNELVKEDIPLSNCNDDKPYIENSNDKYIPGMTLSQGIISNEPILEVLSVNDTITNISANRPTNNDDDVTLMTQNGIGEQAREELNDSLNTEDIENICFDFSEDILHHVVPPQENTKTTLKGETLKDQHRNEESNESERQSDEQNLQVARVPSISPCKPVTINSTSTAVTNIHSTYLSNSTKTLQGLVEELSKLNQYILKCKREIENAHKQREAWLKTHQQYIRRQRNIT